MSRLSHLGLALGIAVSVCGAPVTATAATRAPLTCAPVHIAVDTTGADLVIAFDQGRGFGEVLTLRDTVVSSVRFWIPHQFDSDFVQGFLFITYVDSNAISDHFPRNVIYASQLVTPPIGDGVHLRPFSFTLDPPAALPKPGRYFFLLSEGTCFGGIWLLGQKGNPYLGGDLWETGTSDCSGRAPGSPSNWYPNYDLCIDVTLCDTTVPVQRSSWGRLKERYR